jgi:hypothetical protein
LHPLNRICFGSLPPFFVSGWFINVVCVDSQYIPKTQLIA